MFNTESHTHTHTYSHTYSHSLFTATMTTAIYILELSNDKYFLAD